MRTAWTVVSVIAVAHLLAIAAFAGWLVASGRLDGARLERVRQVLRDAPAEVAAHDAQARRDARSVTPTSLPAPGSAAEVVELRRQEDEAQAQRLARMRREAQDVAAMVARELRRLEERRSEFETERDTFLAMRDRIVALDGDEQFRKALSVLTGLKPADAKVALMELIEGRTDGAVAAINGAGEGIDQAVAYLDAMPSRVRSKVMAEFVADDPTLAADLLERLRTHGIVARASGGSER